MLADGTIRRERRGTLWGHKSPTWRKRSREPSTRDWAPVDGIGFRSPAILVSPRNELRWLPSTPLIHRNGQPGNRFQSIGSRSIKPISTLKRTYRNLADDDREYLA